MKRKRMTPGRFLVAINLAWFAIVSMLLFAVQWEHGRYQGKAESARQLTIKNKLLRREIHNRQWEVDRAREIKKETDALLFFKKATELQHQDWAEIVSAVSESSARWGVRPKLALAIIHRESFFDPAALSSAGAFGLMQVRLAVWGDELGLTEENIRDIKTNIDAGVRILRIYLDANGGDEAAALLEYWAGKKPPNDSYVFRIRSSKFYKAEV